MLGSLPEEFSIINIFPTKGDNLYCPPIAQGFNISVCFLMCVIKALVEKIFVKLT